jgi:hypothetical protein
LTDKWESVVYIARFLPSELPSRKDTARGFIKKSIPYSVLGFLALITASLIIPSAGVFPGIWLSNLMALGDPSKIILHAVLTIVSIWAVSYAIGVLLLEKSRRYYRDYIVRPLERSLKKTQKPI